MADKSNTNITEFITNEEIKTISLKILKIEENSIMVSIDDWRRRIYFEDEFDASALRKNASIEVQYKGDINDPFTVELLKLK